VFIKRKPQRRFSYSEFPVGFREEEVSDERDLQLRHWAKEKKRSFLSAVSTQIFAGEKRNGAFKFLAVSPLQGGRTPKDSITLRGKQRTQKQTGVFSINTKQGKYSGIQEGTSANLHPCTDRGWVAVSMSGSGAKYDAYAQSSPF